MGDFQAVMGDMDDAVLVAVDGEVDVHTETEFSGTLNEAATRAGSRRVVLGCSGLRFIDSAGLAALVRAQHRLRSQGGDLELRDVSRQLYEIMEICGLTKIISVRRETRSG